MHAILEGRDYESYGLIPQKVSRERKRPLGFVPFGLFVVEGNKESELLEGLEAFRLHISNSLNQPEKTRSAGKKSPRGDDKIEQAARDWYLNNRPDPKNKLAVTILAHSVSQLETSILEAQAALSTGKPCVMDRSGGACYSPSPLGIKGEVAFVFPGSGNHYLGMGRTLGIQWPDILRRMDAETQQLKTQLIPDCYVPWRTSWEPGWESAALKKIVSNPLNMIFGQVAHGGVVADLIASFEVKPSAVIGYSLGESAGLFALKVWPDRGKMLERMLDSDLFTEHLAGPCTALRKAWEIPNNENVNWCAAVVNRPAHIVKTVISKWPFARLLIVNTPNQCVVGGRKHHVESAIHELQCEAVFLEGVPTVHCDAATPVAESYKKLHMFPATPPGGIRFYSCARGRSYSPDSENAAISILEQAMSGFNFTTLIEQAYQDGIRIFLEMGPHASCTGMINDILAKQPHLALSACVRGEDDVLTVLKFIGALVSERIPVDLEKLYGDNFFVPTTSEISKEKPDRSMKQIEIPVGNKTPSPSLPITTDRIPSAEAIRLDSSGKRVDALAQDIRIQASSTGISEMISDISKSIEKTAEAHRTFLDFSQELTDNVAKTYSFQTHLLEKIISKKEHVISSRQKPALNRDMCLEFATGSVANVLGPEFAVVDSYEVRVRLPDEPLMLVDRIISVEGEKRSMGSGRVVTEHDVVPGAWYLDGDRVPVCISVEAGQADLFLCSYLGIDHAVKGERSYRLLDAAVKFHRGLPRPGDTIRYEIEIDHFVQQGDTYLFFFSFEGFIGESRLISMFNGCAGFFTKEEMSSSGGIILTEDDTTPRRGKKDPDWIDLVPLQTESYDENAVEALRRGNLAGCFGPLFEGIELAESLRLPGGRMKLIHRILFLDPHGGRYGLGLIRAEADIHPDDWFLTCHFMDDMVMPGTLMYECCAHTLRVFIQRLGWVTSKPGVCYEPVVGVESILKCRGPVTPETKHVWYEVEIKEIGYAPEPFVIANALMYADGHRIVSFKDISMKMTGTCKEDMEAAWKQENQRLQKAEHTIKPSVLYDRDSIIAFAVGKPSAAFGEPYRVFDQERTIARLPGPPYSFLNRIVAIEPEAWELKPDGWIVAEYDVPAEAWYFKADRSGSMPFCVLLEIALQSCGWLAAYMGSALRSDTDLKFRNLGGNAVLKRTIYPAEKKLAIRSRMTKVSEAADMIIEHFEFTVLRDTDIVYSGETYFGFFSQQALAQQVGIREAEKWVYHPTPDELKGSLSFVFEEQAPLSPDDSDLHAAPLLAMPANALLMIDSVDIYIRNGGSKGLGYLRGIKHVKPDEWFFKAHFFQDPVCPGSLGIESFLQLIKFVSLDRWKHLADNHRFELITDQPHNWIYRGQVLPENKKIEVEAVITEVIDTPVPTIYANGFLKVDGLYIYQMENFGFRLVPV
jgi:PfaB family protein